MRDSDERTRHFIIKKKKEENYDEPSVRRIGGVKPEHNEPDDREGDSDDTSMREEFVARYGKKERGSEEQNDRRHKKTSTDNNEDSSQYEYEEDHQKRAPILVRVFAWIALLAIFFVCGYIGANYFFNWADAKGGKRVGNVVGSGSEIKQIINGTETAKSGDAKYKLYIPEDGKLTTREIDIKKGMQEEDIEKVVSMYVDGLKETKILDNNVNTLNVFRSGDWLYLDMTGAFQASLKKLGKEKAVSVISGLVKTMQENFPPIKKIKFYIEGKDTTDKIPVDLTNPWGIN